MTSTKADLRPTKERLLEVDHLSVEFELRGELLRAVADVSFAVDKGETVVMLGESGAGKSLTAMAIMGLLTSTSARVSGHVRYDGVSLSTLTANQYRRYRGARMSIVFQDALSALNPVRTVGYQISEMFREHTRASRSEARERAVDLMSRVGIPSPSVRYGDYPHQFSGGMRQRVMIAMAIALGPGLLIADEPTTALDVTIQAQIMQLLTELRAENNMALLLITHALGVTAEVADRIVVMYAGRVVEIAPALELYEAPAHPYTAGLLASVPTASDRGRELKSIAGSPPSLSDVPSGCAFRTRCRLARERCVHETPLLVDIGTGRATACHFWTELNNGQ